MLCKASLRIVQGCCFWWSDFRPGICECTGAHIEAGTPWSSLWRGAMWIFWVHGFGNTWEKCYLTMGQSVPILLDWKCMCNQICDIGMLMHHTWMHMDAGAAGPYNFAPPASHTDPTSPLFQTKTCSMEWASVFFKHIFVSYFKTMNGIFHNVYGCPTLTKVDGDHGWMVCQTPTGTGKCVRILSCDSWQYCTAPEQYILLTYMLWILPKLRPWLDELPIAMTKTRKADIDKRKVDLDKQMVRVHPKKGGGVSVWLGYVLVFGCISKLTA